MAASSSSRVISLARFLAVLALRPATGSEGTAQLAAGELAQGELISARGLGKVSREVPIAAGADQGPMKDFAHRSLEDMRHL